MQRVLAFRPSPLTETLMKPYRPTPEPHPVRDKFTRVRQELSHALRLEKRIARFDAKVEVRLVSLLEKGRLENRMMRPRQPIQEEHADDGDELLPRTLA